VISPVLDQRYEHQKRGEPRCSPLFFWGELFLFSIVLSLQDILYQKETTMNKLITMLMLLSLALTLPACGSGTSASLTGTSWKLTTWEAGGVQNPTAPGVETSLVFGNDDQVSGNLGCNSFGGTYSVTNGKITFGNLMSTLMACQEPQMSQETHAFQVLRGTASYTLKGDVLTITNGTLSLTLERK
jgi:heat shock protein HslJ